MSTVLFDAPGPRARRRHRQLAAVFSVSLLLILAWAVWRLIEAGSLTSVVFNDTFQNSNIEFLLGGLASTLKAAALAIVTSIVFGILFAVARLSDHRWVSWPAVGVIEFFRAVPLVLLVIGVWSSYKNTIGTLACLVIALTLYNGSVLAGFNGNFFFGFCIF